MGAWDYFMPRRISQGAFQVFLVHSALAIYRYIYICVYPHDLGLGGVQKQRSLSLSRWVITHVGEATGRASGLLTKIGSWRID